MSIATRVILTVPHAKCLSNPPLKSHLCDTAAPKAADEMLNVFKILKIPVALHKATTNRVISDMNRPESRESSWRQAIISAQKNVQVKLVLDVHSFNVNREPPWDDLDLGIMTLGPPQQWHVDMIKHFNAYYPQYRVKHIEGSYLNDIMFVADQMGLPTALLEFSESLDSANLFLLCSIVASFTKIYFDLTN